jgi:hypothetical protein
MYESKGILHYDDVSKKVIVSVDVELAAYYRSLVPKARYVKPQKYAPHITVVRSPPRERVLHWVNWGKYEGELIPFLYDGQIYHNDTYYWIRAYSGRLSQVRFSLGLERHRFLDEPWFHITIGNVK